ncbi:hypothetical protein [Streptacidiphilus rugosus]|uniref:hypothetical protein n=1 Tax=Streptacidiphilus rugosus TaxID=405783 RepID=UPI0012FC3323|nr:hypothetical protein [Streptacidiphilus rugosus]
MGERAVGWRWGHLAPLLVGLLVLGWFGSALRFVGEQDALLRTYRQAQPCPAGQTVPANGCYAWQSAQVTGVQPPDGVDPTTRVTLTMDDGTSARMNLWHPPASFDGLAVGEPVSVGTVRQGWRMDLRRDSSGAVVHGPDYPGYWDGVFIGNALLGVVAGLPLILWGVFGLWRGRRAYPWWALCLLPAVVPVLWATADVDEAPHALAAGAYLPTAVTAAVGLLVGVLLTRWSPRLLSAWAARRALRPYPELSPRGGAPR